VSVGVSVAGGWGAGAAPLPIKFTVTEGVAAALLAITSFPVSPPDAFGPNFTGKVSA
jgi:hypothetical protein